MSAGGSVVTYRAGCGYAGRVQSDFSGGLVPVSKGRKQAAEKKKRQRQIELVAEREKRDRIQPIGDDRAWVAPTFITLGLLGVAWIVVWYITSVTGISVPGMAAIGNWNLGIGMGLMGAAFGVSMLWK